MNNQSSLDNTPKITVCVGAVVLKDDKVLFIRQAYGSLEGKWSLPWGFVDGRTPDGLLEPPDLAAVRETQEEAGVTAKVEGLLGIQNHRNAQGELQIYILYLCRHIHGEPTPDNYETDRAAYLSLDDMDALNEPIDEFCEWIAHRVLDNDYQAIRPVDTNPYHPDLAFI